MITLIIYLVGCIVAVLIQKIHLKIISKNFGKKIIPDLKKFWISYAIFIVTSWIGVIVVLSTMITAWIRKIY